MIWRHISATYFHGLLSGFMKKHIEISMIRQARNLYIIVKHQKGDLIQHFWYSRFKIYIRLQMMYVS